MDNFDFCGKYFGRTRVAAGWGSPTTGKANVVRGIPKAEWIATVWPSVEDRNA